MCPPGRASNLQRFWHMWGLSESGVESLAAPGLGNMLCGLSCDCSKCAIMATRLANAAHCMQEGTGKISLRMLQSYASKHGGETLTLDLKGLFQDFRPSHENFINQQEFLVFFSKVSSTVTNKEFDEMITEMQG